MSAIKTHVVNGPKAGKTLLVMGGIHGNEVCGPIAIGRFLVEHAAGLWPLMAGRIIFAPICNPKAYLEQKRFIDVNLNRVISPSCINPPHTTYEQTLVRSVIDLINVADYVLDIHSYSSGTRPFLFLDKDTPDLRSFASSLPYEDWVAGWPELYAQEESLNSGDTISYALSHNKQAILVECGNHTDPKAPNIAYKTILSTLLHFGFISGHTLPTQTQHTPACYKVETVVTKPSTGEFSKNWQHLDFVQQDTVLASLEDGTVLKSPYAGVILLPDPAAAIGQEWFYMGKTG